MRFFAFTFGALLVTGPVHAAGVPSAPFPLPLDSYHDNDSYGLGGVLVQRIREEPFNLVATVIFFLAILHTFLAPRILQLSRTVQSRYDDQLKKEHEFLHELPPQKRQSIMAALLHFLGEIEAVFGLWAVPLAIAIVLAKGPQAARDYFDHTVHYTEPLFVVVIMAIAASRPVVQFAGFLLGKLAASSPARWWLVLLTVGPLLGSVLTEPAAMTLCAVLLGREFYRLEPSFRFKYATLGLLFVNVSVGGALTNFAAPPILMVAQSWHWSVLYMLQHFGLRIVGGLVINNLAYFLVFRREFVALEKRSLGARRNNSDAPIPFGITAVHLAFLAWTILTAHEPAFFIGGFLFFIAFTRATLAYQDDFNIRSPLLVGFFLAGLVIHGGLQAWWIEPVLSRLSEYPLLIGATILTAFNDNASITYLATLVSSFNEHLKDAVVSGAICGGGLTVIANAPNPAGQSLLEKYFPKGIAAGGLFLAALFPTLVMLVLFALPR